MPVKPGQKPLKKLEPGMGLYQVFHWPDKAPDKSKPWAIANLQTGDVNGRWHATKEEALAQARALYARLGEKAKVHSEETHNAFFCFADAATIPDEGVAWIEAIEAKTYHTPKYGAVEIDEAKIQNFVKNFHDGVRGQEIAIGFEHGFDRAKGDKASGWIRDAKAEGGKLLLGIDFTEPAKAEIANKEWKYFSLEWDDDWLHPDGVAYTDVMMGGTLTNRPVAKGLMPINFSEIVLERGDDLTLVDESKELEHSEPGTGPAPRTDEDGSEDADRRGGWRRETPPIAVDPESLKGGNTLPFELADKDAHELLRALELPVDADGTKVVETVKIKFGELSALREAVDAADQEKIFAEQYPQYWNEHRRLMERDRDNSARAFSESVAKVRKAEGYGLKETKQGLSVQALEKVQELHKLFSEGRPTTEKFEECIKAIVHGGIVTFGELGSSKDDEELPDIDTGSATGIAGARIMFAEVMAKVRRENPEMSFNEALEEAGKKHPDLADAYRVTLPA